MGTLLTLATASAPEKGVIENLTGIPDNIVIIVGVVLVIVVVVVFILIGFFRELNKPSSKGKKNTKSKK